MNKTPVKKGTSNKNRNPKKKTSIKKLILQIALIALVVITGLLLGFIGATMNSLPSVTGVQPAASSRMYDVHGKLISTIHSTENRLPVSINDTPKNLQNAFISAEDARFYSHHGIDPRGILRAVWSNVAHQGIAQGGSTITQQLARNAFLSQERTLSRKIKEALLAIKIEQNYSKPEILEMYMNQIYFGQGAYGVQAASRTYFGTDVDQLTLPQCALLAGLPNSPNYLNPFHNLKAAKERQELILSQMAKYGYITEEQEKVAKAAPLNLLKAPSARPGANIYSYFEDYVIQQISKKYGDDALYKGGLQIYTTLDADAQKAAVDALKHLPTFYTDKNGVAQPQGALVAINPHNGYIVAMVGGRGTDFFNRAVLAERQPGSAFKPFVYLTAIQQGMTPGTIIDDKAISFGSYNPHNYGHNFSGRMTLRYALTHSVNTIAVQLADQVGMNRVLANAKAMGLSTLSSSSDNNLAAALGGLTNGVTPLDMASAYGVLADGGIRVSPVSITKIIDRNGKVLEENKTEERRVISAKDAAVITNMLQSVVNSGTGGRAYFGRPAAGKTGTTDSSKDAWFVGYTPNLSCAVWMGDDYGSENLHGITGGSYPAEIWRLFMQKAVANLPLRSFPIPSSAAGLVKLGYESPKDIAKKDKEEKEKKEKDKKNKDKVEKKNAKLLKRIRKDAKEQAESESTEPVKKVTKVVFTDSEN